MATKQEEATFEAHASAVENIHGKHDTVAVDHRAEHELTVKDVFTKHPWVVVWSFYWAMVAVGW